MSNENVEHTKTPYNTGNINPAAPDTPAHPSPTEQTSDDSLPTAQVSAASSAASIPAELLGQIKSTTSYDSNLYMTAESSPLTLQKEASSLSNPEAGQYNRMDQLDQYLNETNNTSNNESFPVFTPDESTDKIDRQLRQIEDMTKESLNKYFDKNIMKFVDDFNNNRLEFDRPLHSSSNDNLNQELSAHSAIYETSDNIIRNNLDNINTNTTIENLLEESINNDRSASGKVSPLKAHEYKKSELPDGASILNKSFMVEDEANVPEEALKSSFQMIEDLSKCIKEMIEEDKEIEESFDLVEKSELEDMSNTREELQNVKKETAEILEGKNTCEDLIKNLNDINERIDEETKDHLDKIILSNIEDSTLSVESEYFRDVEDDTLRKLDSIVQMFVGTKQNTEPMDENDRRSNIKNDLNDIIESSLINIKHEVFTGEENSDKSEKAYSDEELDNFETIVEYFIEQKKQPSEPKEIHPNNLSLDPLYFDKLKKVVEGFIGENESPLMERKSLLSEEENNLTVGTEKSQRNNDASRVNDSEIQGKHIFQIKIQNSKI